MANDSVATDASPGSSKSEQDQWIVTYVAMCKEAAKDARRYRDHRSQLNRGMYLGQQDFSHKTEGQSAEFIPKTGTAVESMAAFVERSLTSFGNWFQLEDERRRWPITEDQARDLLMCYLKRMPDGPNKMISIETVLTDSVKVGLLESLIVLKIHGETRTERKFVAEVGDFSVDPTSGKLVEGPEELTTEERDVWRLRVSVLRTEDYYPDPTGAGLYEIHSVERDLHTVMESAEAGMYDVEAVKAIASTAEKPRDEDRRESGVNQSESQKPSFRKTVVIDEFWGTILDRDGTVIGRNVVAAVANGQHLIRKPTDNPHWHQESPFVAGPLLRVPFSVWHKAIYDDASPLNQALNELMNLMIDGGIEAVWGIGQVRPHWLLNPEEISDGISPGDTLALNQTAPVNAKAYERVSSGGLPPEAVQLFALLESEFTSASLSNELRLGRFPQRTVKATEVLEVDEAQSTTIEAVAGDLEIETIEPMLRKSFLAIMQNVDPADFANDEVIAAIGPTAALRLYSMTPAQRYQAFAVGCGFKARGLTATLAKARDFQKLMALAQAAAGNPLLFQAFLKRFSLDKFLDRIIQALNIAPADLALSEDEKAEAPNREAQVLATLEAMGGRNGGPQNTITAEQTGDAAVPAEVSQNVQPLTGLAPGGSL